MVIVLKKELCANISSTVGKFAETAKQTVRCFWFGLDTLNITCCPNMESVSSSPRSRNQSGGDAHEQDVFQWKLQGIYLCFYFVLKKYTNLVYRH